MSNTDNVPSNPGEEDIPEEEDVPSEEVGPVDRQDITE